MQEELDNAILAEKPEMAAEERFNQTLVSLDVEIAEIANCSEHFKFWKNNKGKFDEKRFYECKSPYFKEIYYFDRLGNNNEKLTRQQAHKLTLVEECSDALHFILSLANQNDFKIYDDENISLINSVLDFPLNRQHSLDNDYLSLQKCIQKIDYIETFMCGYNEIIQLVASFIIYIEKLGITTEELEQAYYDKNEINYKRLREGY